MIKRLCCILTLLLAAAGGAEGPREWYHAEGIVPIVNITTEKARENAWKQAQMEAVSQSSLEVIGATAMRIQESEKGEAYDQFAQFVRTATRGRIVAVDTLFDDSEKISIPGSGRSELIYRVEIRAQVQPEMGIPDPAFQLKLDLNKKVFANGEALIMELTATQECYVTVLNLYANDSLLVVFPNERLPDGRIEAEKTRRIPPFGAGWELPVGLLPGRDSDQEMLLAVATKKPVPFLRGRDARQGLLAVDEALLAINNWLIDIPTDQRTETMASYRIVK